MNLFEEESKTKSAKIPSSSPEAEEDSSACFGIHDSLTLKNNNDIQKLFRDDVFDGDLFDISQQEVDRAWEAENDDLASVSSRLSSSPERRGERRGQQQQQQHDSAEAEPTSSETLIVMTKTHDGSSREKGTSGLIVIHSASPVGSSLNTASAA
eukprot:scaffold3353_cov144-Skeletonema_menzelii.AAC.20